MVRASRCVCVAVAVFVFSGCGPAKVEPTLDVTARPRAVDNKGGKSTITVSAVDALGKAGTGKVTVTSSVGSLKAGADATLSGGSADFEFSCDLSTDATCLGSAKIDASWSTTDGVKVTAQTSISITAPAVPDGGKPDAGTPMGVLDGGTFGEYSMTLVLEKTLLQKGTGDSMKVTAHVTKTATPNVGVAGASVAFTAGGGASFAQVPTPTTTVNTNAAGDAVATLSVGTATNTVLLNAVTFDATAFVGVPVVNVAAIKFVGDTRTKFKLTIQSTGRDSSTPVFFQVTDSMSKPVQGIDVNFDIGAGSAAGCSVTNSARTDDMGLVQTILATGEARGSVTVRAVVAATAGTAKELLQSAPPFEVTIGRPSDGNFGVLCSKQILGALEISSTPPRNDLSTTCTVSTSDRYGTFLPFSVDVLWATEAGSLQSSTTTDTNGRSTNTYLTAANSLPEAVEPFVGEPYNGSKNPRDMFVTIIAATTGEEEFWDRAADGGVGNGQWDPGEWFVDQPEPFIDSNDNGQYDDGEKFFDTERVNCATGMKLAKNLHWDGPNGCWDSSTLIWRSAHIIYSGTLTTGAGQSGPFLVFNPPATVQNDAVVQVPFSWYDAYYNRISNDGISVTVPMISGTRGAASIVNLTTGETFGHQLSYYTARGTEVNGVITENGSCDPVDRNASPLTGERCFRRFRITAWRSSALSGLVQFIGPPVQTIPGQTTSQFQLVGSNTLAAPTLGPIFSVTYPQ